MHTQNWFFSDKATEYPRIADSKRNSFDSIEMLSLTCNGIYKQSQRHDDIKENYKASQLNQKLHQCQQNP